jgi:hypothetical protein
MNFPDLAIGSIVYGAAGKSAKVLSIEGDLLTINTLAGIRTIPLAKVARVEPPPTGIQVGDRMRRKIQSQTKYPKAWFPKGIDPRPPMIDAIASATVERVSLDGYWVKTTEDKTYHISESSIEEGVWELEQRQKY